MVHFGPPPFGAEGYCKVPQKPKHLRDVPRYLRELIGGFFKRLFYIYGIVWQTNPAILITMLLISTANGVLPLAGAYLTAEILNRLVTSVGAENGLQLVATMLILQAVYLFVSRIVGVATNIVNRISGELVVNTIKLKLMNKAREIDLADYDRPEFYERLENANREAGMRPVQILSATFTLVSSCISMISFIVVLWAISPAAPGIIALLALPQAIVSFIYRKKNVNYMRFRSKDRRQMEYYSRVMTDKDLAKEVRLFDLSDTMINSYQSVFKKYYRGLKRLIFSEHAWSLGFSLLSTAAHCLLFVYVAKLVTDGSIGVGDYTLYTGALNSVSAGVMSLVSTTSTIYEGTLFIDNMIAFMNEPITIRPTVEEPKQPKRGCGHRIEFRNVSFCYPDTEVKVLEGINLVIREGESLVLVGQNGAGKTTLIKLITRLYDPTEGEILLDGINIKEYSLRQLYDIYGIIFQDFGRYAFTVRENITFGEINAPNNEQRVLQAAHQSNADSFIDHLSDGYETPLMRIFEPNGTELSTGQWQKLSVARAFYGTKDIIILDEPTASLDPLAEQEIYQQFDELREGKTTIFVSHRLSNAVNASKIIVLERGKIIEEGTHTQLMAKGEGGAYHKLFTAQAGRYIETMQESESMPK
ncbi:MAG: ABC transporter ATP-binding protein [Clostridia bacterium]|nr:ABC transporter ATP-binding protein [Clostridia bacterium]